MALLMVAKSGEEWDALLTSEDQPRAAAFEEGLVVLLNDQGWGEPRAEHRGHRAQGGLAVHAAHGEAHLQGHHAHGMRGRA